MRGEGLKPLISLNMSVQVPVTQRELTAVTELLLGAGATPETEAAHEMVSYGLGPLGTVLLI